MLLNKALGLDAGGTGNPEDGFDRDFVKERDVKSQYKELMAKALNGDTDCGDAKDQNCKAFLREAYDSEVVIRWAMNN